MLNRIAIETVIDGPYRGVIGYDLYPEEPPCDDEAIVLATSHPQFTVGPQEIFKRGKSELEKEYHCFPVRAYIHSGVSLSLSATGYPFTDAWDSCWVGAVFITKKAGVWGSDFDPRKAAQSLIDSWNIYLSGTVLCYEIYRDDEVVDSCYGFYTDVEYVVREMKEQIEFFIRQDRMDLENNRMENMVQYS